MTEESLVLMRNSERSTYRDCGLKWHWSYNLRLASPRSKGALTFGSMCHDALEVYYPPGKKRGPHPAQTFIELFDAQPEKFDQWDDEGNRVPARDMGIAMLEGYVDEYGQDINIEILQPEIPMQIDIIDRHGNYVCTWVGKGDAAYRDLTTGRVGFLEHKTAKIVPDEVPVNSGYGDQGLAYYWAGEQWFRHQGWLKKNEHLSHIEFNWLRKGLPDARPKNAEGLALNKPSKAALTTACELAGLPSKGTIDVLVGRLLLSGWTQSDVDLLGEVSKTQSSKLFHRFRLDFGPGQLAMINQRMRDEARMMAMARAGEIPILKNPNKDCSWKCEFKDACELHEMGADFQSILDLEMVKWDPYEDHKDMED